MTTLRIGDAVRFRRPEEIEEPDTTWGRWMRDSADYLCASYPGWHIIERTLIDTQGDTVIRLQGLEKLYDARRLITATYKPGDRVMFRTADMLSPLSWGELMEDLRGRIITVTDVFEYQGTQHLIVDIDEDQRRSSGGWSSYRFIPYDVVEPVIRPKRRQLKFRARASHT